MPKVELYGPPKVATRPIAGARLTNAPSPEVFGAGLGATIANIGERAFSMHEAEQRRIADQAYQDAVAVQDQSAQRQYSEAIYAIVHDKDNGAMYKEGLDAANLPREVHTALNEAADKIAGTLTNDDSRQHFERYRQAQWDSILPAVTQHSANEIAKYDTTDLAARVDISYKLAGAKAETLKYATTPLEKQSTATAMMQDIQDGVDAIKAYAGRHPGLPQADVDLRVLNAYTAGHTTVINQLLANEQPAAARVWFDEAKAAGQIAGDAIPKLVEALDQGELQGDAQTRADAIRTAGGTRQERLDKVRAISQEGGENKAKLRTATQQLVEHDLDLEEQDQRDAADKLMVNAGNLVDTGGLKAVMTEPGMWVAMSPAQKHAIEEYADRKNKGGVATDWTLYYKLRNMAADEPEKFVKETLPGYINRLEKGKLEELIDIQMRIKTGDHEKLKKLDEDHRSDTMVIDNVLQAAGIDPSDKDNNKKVSFFRNEVAIEKVRMQGFTGHEATPEEVKGITEKLLATKVLNQGYFWNSDQNLLDADISDVPEADKARIREDFRTKHDVPNPTSDQILQAWLHEQVTWSYRKSQTSPPPPTPAPKKP